MAKTIRTSAEQITRLRTYNIVAGVMHLLQAVAFGYFLSRIENQVTFDATVDYMTGPPGAGFPTEKVVLWEVNLGLGVVAFLALSAFFHFLIASPLFYKRYAAGLERNHNYFRWVEYSISSSVMIWLLLDILLIR